MIGVRVSLLNKRIDVSVYLCRINSNQVRLCSNSCFFNDEIIVNIDDEKIVFTKPTIDYRGKLYKMTKIKNNGDFQATITTDIEFGTLEIEEDETDCDRITIYYS